MREKNLPMPMTSMHEACEFVDELEHGESLVIEDYGSRYVLMSEATYLTIKEQLIRRTVIDLANAKERSG